MSSVSSMQKVSSNVSVSPMDYSNVVYLSNYQPGYEFIDYYQREQYEFDQDKIFSVQANGVTHSFVLNGVKYQLIGLGMPLENCMTDVNLFDIKQCQESILESVALKCGKFNSHYSSIIRYGTYYYESSKYYCRVEIPCGSIANFIGIWKNNKDVLNLVMRLIISYLVSSSSSPSAFSDCEEIQQLDNVQNDSLEQKLANQESQIQELKEKLDNSNKSLDHWKSEYENSQVKIAELESEIYRSHIKIKETEKVVSETIDDCKAKEESMREKLSNLDSYEKENVGLHETVEALQRRLDIAAKENEFIANSFKGSKKEKDMFHLKVANNKLSLELIDRESTIDELKNKINLFMSRNMPFNQYPRFSDKYWGKKCNFLESTVKELQKKLEHVPVLIKKVESLKTSINIQNCSNKLNLELLDKLHDDVDYLKSVIKWYNSNNDVDIEKEFISYEQPKKSEKDFMDDLDFSFGDKPSQKEDEFDNIMDDFTIDLGDKPSQKEDEFDNIMDDLDFSFGDKPSQKEDEFDDIDLDFGNESPQKGDELNHFENSGFFEAPLKIKPGLVDLNIINSNNIGS